MDILKVYPSGRVTASRRKKFNLEALSCKQTETEQQDFDIRQVQIHGFDKALMGKKSVMPSHPLGLSSVANLSALAESHTDREKKKRGQNGITSRSRQLVKDAATILENRYGKSQLAFVTHTIPDHAITYVHANWQKILANLRRRYLRALQKAGLPQEIVMVSEYQERRLEETGQAVLHLHIVFVGRFKKRHWQYKCEYYAKHWEECCEEYKTNTNENGRWNAATRVESIRKSCANYLAKYMSKGVSTLDSIRSADSNAFIPPSWHILSQSLRQAVRKATRHFEGGTATDLFEWLLSEAVNLLRFNRFVKIPTKDGRESCVGWYGDLKDRKLFDSVAML